MQVWQLVVAGIFGAFIAYTIIETKRFCLVYPSNSRDTVHEIIRRIIRQAARWTTASEQDATPLVKVVHANYGAAYMFALNDAGIRSDDVEDAMGSGFQYQPFYDHIVQQQDNANKAAVSESPSFGPPKTSFTLVGGE